jgi:hypothetical protein
VPDARDGQQSHQPVLCLTLLAVLEGFRRSTIHIISDVAAHNEYL